MITVSSLVIFLAPSRLEAISVFLVPDLALEDHAHIFNICSSTKRTEVQFGRNANGMAPVEWSIS